MRWATPTRLALPLQNQSPTVNAVRVQQFFRMREGRIKPGRNHGSAFVAFPRKPALFVPVVVCVMFGVAVFPAAMPLPVLHSRLYPLFAVLSD